MNYAHGFSQEITNREGVKSSSCISLVLPLFIPFVLILAWGHTEELMWCLLNVSKLALYAQCVWEHFTLYFWSNTLKNFTSHCKSRRHTNCIFHDEINPKCAERLGEKICWMSDHLKGRCNYVMSATSAIRPFHCLLSYLLAEQGSGHFLDIRCQQLGSSDDFAQCRQWLVDTLRKTLTV